MPAPSELSYAVLSQCNPERNAALIDELSDLYRGGYTLAANATKYLPKIANESDARHKERAAHTAYVPYLSHIIDHFASAVFSQPLHVRPAGDDASPNEEFYEAFADDADLTSSAFHEIAKRLLTTALLQRRAILAVDFPPPIDGVNTLLDEENSGGTRAYVYEVPLEQLLDWEVETVVKQRVELEGGHVEFDVGWFRWAILHSHKLERASYTDSRSVRVDTWKVWHRTDEGGVGWDTYQLKRKADAHGKFRDPSEKAKIPWVDGGVTSFKVIPLVEMSLPDGLWVGNRLGPLVKEHFQRRSMINSSENRSLGATGFIKLGPEVPAVQGELPSHVQQNPNRADEAREFWESQGLVVLGSDDDLGFVEPKGGYAELAENRLSKLVDEIYRVSHLMAASVSSTSTSVGRSGTSKQEDRHATAIVLSALGCVVREMARRAYEVISDAREEVVDWVATGLDHFDMWDRASLVAEAVQIDTVNIPSTTFKTAYKSELASRLMPGMSPEEQSKVRDEIEAGVKASEAAAEEAKKALAAGPQAAPGDQDEEDDTAEPKGPPKPPQAKAEPKE